MDGISNMDDVQTAAEPKLCGVCFSFFGNPASLGMCSKCYREHEAEEAKVNKQAQAVADVIASNVSTPPPPSSPPPAQDTQMEEAVVSVPQPSTTTPGSSPTASPAPQPAAAADAATSTAAAAAAAPVEEEKPPPPERPVQKNPSRCFSCNKRVGLTGFKCRCEYVFCSTHRYSDKHNCEYDYKAANRDLLTKANPTIVADKVQRI
jgi:hypothetical protein